MAYFDVSAPWDDGPERSPPIIRHAASPLSNWPHLTLSAQTLMMHRPGEIEHDARHGGSNGCPT